MVSTATCNCGKLLRKKARSGRKIVRSKYRRTRQTISGSSVSPKFDVFVGLYPNFEMLDVFGPLEMFAMNSTSFNVRTFSKQTASLVVSRYGPSVSATMNFGEAVSSIVLAKKADNPNLSMLFIPGSPDYPAHDKEWVDFVRTTAPQCDIVFTVCTGSAVLAATGLLNNRKATTNKMLYDNISSTWPLVNWQKLPRWVVDGNIWTSSGVSAGTDMAVEFIRVYLGEDSARSTCRYSEYNFNSLNLS